MCKATTQRIKGRGMRWDGDNAESIMALEALEQSGAWQTYWGGAALPRRLTPERFATPLSQWFRDAAGNIKPEPPQPPVTWHASLRYSAWPS